MDASGRERELKARLRTFGSVVIGYSGGVDSAYLAAVALESLGAERVLAVTGHSASVPHAQRRSAAELAGRLGLPHLEIATNELSDPRYTANPTDRCFFCKSELWSRLEPIAEARGGAALLDGSNADDRKDWRPGFRAAARYGVRSPLLEVGLTKADIRVLSRARDLPTWDQPAAPCLSSRIPYGLAVTPERLRAIEEAEDALRALGFRVFRVRHHGEVARVEVAAGELEHAVACAGDLLVAMHAAGFAQAVLDVEGYRSGGLNEGLPLVQLALR